jgi:hypothetical protein
MIADAILGQSEAARYDYPKPKSMIIIINNHAGD